MAGLCEGGNEPRGSLKANKSAVFLTVCGSSCYNAYAPSTELNIPLPIRNLPFKIFKGCNAFANVTILRCRVTQNSDIAIRDAGLINGLLLLINVLCLQGIPLKPDCRIKDYSLRLSPVDGYNICSSVRIEVQTAVKRWFRSQAADFYDTEIQNLTADSRLKMATPFKRFGEVNISEIEF
ncbi:hypothetical protein ANN_16794 [Periplaneta americana]|uniref:Uncharacterized protein n=1 Tax=Periplaneta americana TaxID=6978 RepID=A0ABQ8SR37_PERAM|nr:hypothetical protein ANN_16794 [Periplaneta americana]